MALQKTMTFPCKVKKVTDFGSFSEDGTISLSDAYIKVERIEGSKEKVVAFVSFNSPDGVGNQSYAFVPSVDSSSDNFIKQAYEHLKSLNEFNGAEDC